MQVDPNEKVDPEDQGPRLDSLDFWHRLIACLVSVIEEDRNVYSPKMNQFPHELNVGQLSASTIFSLLAVDIKYALEEHEQHRLCESSGYMNLNFAVKRFYVKHIKEVPPYKGSVPEYPAWFEPFVMQWLNENDDVSLEYLKGAYARDKKDGVSFEYLKSSCNFHQFLAFFFSSHAAASTRYSPTQSLMYLHSFHNASTSLANSSVPIQKYGSGT